MSALEQEHWWFVGRRAVVFSLLRRFASHGALLDVGVGTGLNAALFAKAGYSVTGIEPSADAISFAKQKAPSVHIIETTFPSSDIPSDTYDVVVMLDVLEHLDDDRAGLAEVRRVLKPGGVLLVTVPAFAFLWSGHDELAHHHRRYRRGELVRKFVSAGLTPTKTSYYNFFLFPAIAVIRLLKSVLRITNAESDFGATPRFLNTPLALLFGSERFLLRFVSLPFGVSLVAVAKK
jgi:2-polyprenyl-3-methyl-5-hydroxy-6-metoxy-1,4-benzoquinol methylase